MKLHRISGQGLINAVGVMLTAILVLLGAILVDFITGAAQINVNGQTTAGAASTALAASQAIQGDRQLALTISQEDGLSAALRNQADAMSLLLMTRTNLSLLHANRQVEALYFFKQDGSYLFGQHVDPNSLTPGLAEEPPAWYATNNRLRATLQATLSIPAQIGPMVLSFDPMGDHYGTLSIFQPILAQNGRAIEGVLVEQVSASTIFAPYVHRTGASGSLFVAGNIVIGPMLAVDEARNVLPVVRVDRSLDQSITGGMAQIKVPYSLSAKHPGFSVAGHDVVGSRQPIGKTLINGKPLLVINYANAGTISDATRRVLVMVMAFVAFLVIGIGGLILYLNGRLVRRERESARSIQLKNLELTDANKQLERMATTDALTDLPNRTLLNDRLAQSLLVADRLKSTLGLLLLDLDRFKEINDTLGHAYGDIMLQQVSQRLRRALRASDTVARLGGDEFAVLVPSVSIDGAQAIASKILEELAVPFQIEGLVLDVGASIGIAVYPEHGRDAAVLLRLADVAMYVAKRRHGGAAVYSMAEDKHSPHRLVLMTDLRQAISQGALLLYYQPKVDLTTGRIHSVEGLVRWPKQDNTFIPPEQFIQLAEYTGLIGPLTDWVLESAIRQCRLWQDAGLQLGVAVNLSMRTLHDNNLPSVVADLLRRHGISPERLTLEITESALMADMGRALDVIARLGANGVRVAIDDFGTGYSSLGYLKRLPVHEIKLDKSFVLGLGSHADRRDEAIIRSVIEMAHALDRTVVAEGVEQRAAWHMLRDFGCDVAQGYYISRPLPAAELVRWLAASPWGKLATVG